jgi:ABC-type transporter Mla MlaB component
MTYPVFSCDPIFSMSNSLYLAGELKEKHQYEDDDERIEDRAGEDLFELELDDSGSSAAVGRVTELLRLVKQRVKVVLVPGKSEKLLKLFKLFKFLKLL